MWIVQPCWFHLSMTTSQKNHPLVEESIPLDTALFWLQYDWTKSQQIHQKSNQPKLTYSKCMLPWNKTPPQQKQWFYCKKTQNIYIYIHLLKNSLWLFWVENLTFQVLFVSESSAQQWHHVTDFCARIDESAFSTCRQAGMILILWSFSKATEKITTYSKYLKILDILEVFFQ